MSVALEFELDDLSRAEVHALIRRHLAGMHENSPACSVHALDIDKLRRPDVTFWTGWVRDNLAVMGALKRLDAENGEIKSMRVDDRWLGRGYGRKMLSHISTHARLMGLKALWLETGSTAAFEPAIRLYESAGFTFCGPFADYADDPFSRFMTRAV
jgi:putative acetyltransferase